MLTFWYTLFLNYLFILYECYNVIIFNTFTNQSTDLVFLFTEIIDKLKNLSLINIGKVLINESVILKFKQLTTRW